MVNLMFYFDGDLEHPTTKSSLSLTKWNVIQGEDNPTLVTYIKLILKLNILYPDANLASIQLFAVPAAKTQDSNCLYLLGNLVIVVGLNPTLYTCDIFHRT